MSDVEAHRLDGLRAPGAPGDGPGPALEPPFVPLASHGRLPPMLASEGWLQRRPFYMVPFMIFMFGTLILSGYPAPRLALLFANLAVLEAFVYLFIRRSICQHARAESGADPMRHHTRGNVVVLLLMLLGVGLSGGIYSPFAVLLPLPIVGPVIFYGRSKETSVTLSILVGGVLLLCLLPEGWRGPRVSSPYDLILIAGSIVFAIWTTAASLTDLLEMARVSHHALSRMREDLLQQSLERTRSLEAVSGRVAHDLKNPLAAVKALAQLLQRSAADERSKERLDVIYKEIASMETIITQYLSFSRPLQDLKVERFELGDLVESVFAVLEARASDAGVTLEQRGDNVFLKADPRRLKEVFLNLVSNAIDATPQGGKVAVEIRAEADRAEVVVRDDGRGMTPEELSRVGTPYFTTRAGGTGLGVVLAKTVVEQHGGRIAYESEVGRGTRVKVSVPLEPCAMPGCFPLPDSRPSEPARSPCPARQELAAQRK